MKTKDLAVWSIQSNMVGATVTESTCDVLLANVDHLIFKCEDWQAAGDIYNTLMFYPISGRVNNAIVMGFKFEMTHKKG